MSKEIVIGQAVLVERSDNILDVYYKDNKPPLFYAFIDVRGATSDMVDDYIKKGHVSGKLVIISDEEDGNGLKNETPE